MFALRPKRCPMTWTTRVRASFFMLFFLAGTLAAAKSPPVGLFDLTYTLKLDMDNPAQVRRAWDEVHALATLQGIVNRDNPLLYFFYIENGGVNLERYWWAWYRKPGNWLKIGRASCRDRLR